MTLWPGRKSRGQKSDAPRLIFATAPGALGQVLIAGFSGAASKDRVCFLSLGDDQTYNLNELIAAHPDHKPVRTKVAFKVQLASVLEFIEHPAKPIDFAMEMHGTEFQKRVWNELSRTQPGETLTYRELADRVGSPGSSRAVGAACGQNRIALAIPCHRAVRSDGNVSGYRWGLERKYQLLERERLATGRIDRAPTNQLPLRGFDSPYHSRKPRS